MAKQRRKRKNQGSGPTQPKFKPKRSRSVSEKVFLVLGILIALSMVLSLFVMNIPLGG